jgi:hypothetical protein
MKKIKLSGRHGGHSIVDDEDFNEVSKYSWYYNAGYAMAKSREYKNVLMHRIILNTPKGMETDHINGDGLDNRRCNLRICTTAQNQWNRIKRKDNNSGFKGVSLKKATNKFIARITVNKKRMYIGTFVTAKEASIAYNIHAKKYHAEFVRK